jgi:hypothetical protein
MQECKLTGNAVAVAAGVPPAEQAGLQAGMYTQFTSRIMCEQSNLSEDTVSNAAASKGGTVSLQDCDLACGRTGVLVGTARYSRHCGQSSARLQDCRIVANQQYGVQLLHNAHMLAVNCKFERNGAGSVNSTDPSGSVAMYDCTSTDATAYVRPCVNAGVWIRVSCEPV